MNTEQVKSATQAIQLRLKVELHTWIRQQAAQQERSANWMINKIIEDAKNMQGAQA